MEDILYLILAILYGIAYFIGLVVCVFGGAIVGTVTGIAHGFVCVGEACRTNFNFRSWESPAEDDGDPAIKRYLFGPGHQQLKSFYSASTWYIERENKSFLAERNTCILDENRFRRTFGRTSYSFSVFYVKVYIYTIFTVIWAVFGILLSTGSLVMLLVCLAVRAADRSFLQIRRIRADCPVHKGSFRIPAFRCSNPDCGRLHRKIVPNGYGILFHRCVCGSRLPSTVFTRRNRLKPCCPVPGCEGEMIAADTRPLVFQLIGGSGAGKTTFLASAVHILRQRAAASERIRAEIPADYQGVVNRLERIYAGEDSCQETVYQNAAAIPLLFHCPHKTNRLLSFYDISGKRFSEDARTNNQQQTQFGYCDAFLFLLDPFSSGELRSRKEQNGVLPEIYSSDRAEDVIVSFVNYLIYLGVMKVNQPCLIPLYVLITKADQPEVLREIPDWFQRGETEQGGSADSSTSRQGREAFCRDFLCRHDLASVLSALKSFQTVYFYFISSTGLREGPDRACAPQGIDRLLDDLLERTGSYLSKQL